MKLFAVPVLVSRLLVPSELPTGPLVFGAFSAELSANGSYRIESS